MNRTRSLAAAVLMVSTMIGAAGSAGAADRGERINERVLLERQVVSGPLVLPEHLPTPPGVPIPYPNFVKGATARR